jgi:tRNA uridine 5-carboxymethylaminomethyl modification enzyme
MFHVKRYDKMFNTYDVIVVGGGHAGSEAAAAAAKMGAKTILITMDMMKMAQMSCNPAMGGVAKGQIIREIDAIGGYSGIVSDRSAIQFRMLNRSKGPAMWSPRTQNDRVLFSTEWRSLLEQVENLDFWQDTVVDLIEKSGRITGVKTAMGITIHCKALILTSGTFMNGIIHIGEEQYKGGRIGDRASYGITEKLNSWGFHSGRMKTGTPPRIDGRSLNYSRMEEQKGDENPGKFSFWNTKPLKKQRSCWITYTNPGVHDELRTGFEFSPMFNGRIEGIGPRYCPSIEDKIDRFSDKDRHQIFVEPEGWNTVEMYINGFSTSLPKNVQLSAIRRIPGFENAKMFRPGYAIEYDFFPPLQIKKTLETKLIEGLFFSGQINGTTGYEEAASQGLIAGINAVLSTRGEAPFVLERNEAYIGVLIDDLVTKGTDEPYRMFTSRAEHRILLRQDNADERLFAHGLSFGLHSDERKATFEERSEFKKKACKVLDNESADPDTINSILVSKNTGTIKQKVKWSGIIRRPQIKIQDIIPLSDGLKKLSIERKDYQELLEQVEIEYKYEGYINREKEFAKRLKDLDSISIPVDFAYEEMKSMSSEAREKLKSIKPMSLGQASRISGVSPADISALLIKMGR